MTAELLRFALDTNVLVYFADDDAGSKQERARNIVARAAVRGRCILPMQTIGEFFATATRKRLVEPGSAALRARDFMRLFAVAEPVTADADAALDLAATGRLSYWDGLLLATAARAGCVALISEDMQDGATIAGVTVHNPFIGDTLPEPVAALLA
jgi:predicted nucleic acid-binding protein